jgi:hypothetical protein
LAWRELGPPCILVCNMFVRELCSPPLLRDAAARLRGRRYQCARTRSAGGGGLEALEHVWGVHVGPCSPAWLLAASSAHSAVASAANSSAAAWRSVAAAKPFATRLRPCALVVQRVLATSRDLPAAAVDCPQARARLAVSWRRWQRLAAARALLLRRPARSSHSSVGWWRQA